MSSFYGEQQWNPGHPTGYEVPAGAPPPGAQHQQWDHQTPPTRSGASSTNPRETSDAFFYQFQELEKARAETNKSGKLPPGPGMGMPMPPVGRRESQPHSLPGPARFNPDFEPRLSGGPGRPQSPGYGSFNYGAFGGRGGPGGPAHPSNLQNFYATQRHQPSRGSNDAEQMQQNKRRFAAQRERELRNYHQDLQSNRTATYPPGPTGSQDVSVAPNQGPHIPVPNLQPTPPKLSGLYGQGPFVGELTGGSSGPPMPPHQGGPSHDASSNLRGGGALPYGSFHQEVGSQAMDPASAGTQPRERTSSNASPQSNPPGPKGQQLEQTNRTSNSSPGSASPQNGRAPGGKVVAPIGTRPSISQGPGKQSTTTTPLSYGASEAPSTSSAMGGSTAATTTTEGSSLSGTSNWGQRSGGPWGSSKSQQSVWG